MPKPLSALSPAYRRRLENYARKHGVSVSEARTAARGHARTPERPERVIGREHVPPKYQDWLNRWKNDVDAVNAKKRRVFPLPGSKKRLSQKRSDRNTETNGAIPGASGRPNRARMRQFLNMNDAEIADIDWSDTDWGFLFYH